MITAISGVHLGLTELALDGLSADDTRFNTTAGRTRVLFDGVAAPVIYSSIGQISVSAPYPRTTTSVLAALQAMFTAN